MKLKYYLRGMGIGVILTAIVMGFALGGRKTTISDAEVIERAKALGMIDGKSGVLSSGSNEGNENVTFETTSDTSLDQAGEEISQEIYEGFSSSGESIFEVAENAQEGKTDASKDTTAKSEVPKETTAVETQKIEDAPVATTEAPKEEKKEAAAEASTPATVTSTETASASEASGVPDTTEQKQEETASAGNETAQEEPTVTTGSRTVTIPGGMGSDGVAQILFNEGIIDNATSFNRYLVDRKMDRIIRSGTKTIPAGADYETIANIICK